MDRRSLAPVVITCGALTVALWAMGLGCYQLPPSPKITRDKMTVEQHEEYFPIGEFAVHSLGKEQPFGPWGAGGPVSCDACHDGGKSFQEFRCTNCHEPAEGVLESRHALIDAFVLENPRCIVCHPIGHRGSILDLPPPPPPPPGVDAGPPPPPPYDHDNLAFPYSEGTPHSPVNDPGNDDDYMDRAADLSGGSHCLGCHADAENDRTLTRCAECHALDTNPDLAFVHIVQPTRSGFEEVADCKACHQSTPVPPDFDLPTHNAKSCSNHFSADCFQCHSQTQLSGQPKEWAIDFSIPAAPVTCAACHPEARAYPVPCP